MNTPRIISAVLLLIAFWGAVLIDVDVDSDVAAGWAVVRPRVAIPVFITVTGTESPRARLTDLRAYMTAAGEVVVSGIVTNEGNALLHAPLVLALEDASSTVPTELAFIEDAVITVLPGGKRTFRLRLPADNLPRREALCVTAWLRFDAAATAVAEASCAVAARPACDSDACLST